MLRFRRFRRLRVFAAFFCLPIVLIFSTPTTAHAATTGIAKFSMSTGKLGDVLPWEGATCQLPWQTNTGGLVISASSRCDGGPDTTPGYCQAYEGACGSYGVVLKDNLGSTCGSTAMQPFDIGGGVGSVKAGLGGGYISYADECQPISLCLSYYLSSSFSVTDYQSCQPIDLDDTPTSGGAGSCASGTPSAHLTARKTGDPNAYYQDEYVLNVTLPTSPGTVQWGYAVRGVKGGNVPVTGRVNTIETVVHSVGQHKVNNAPAPVVPAGASVELYAYPDVAGWNKAPNPTMVNGVSGDGNAVPIATVLPTSGALGQDYHGLTDPYHCRFYFGPKVVNFTGTDMDEPQGDGVGPVLPPEPDPMPEPVEPVDDTPDTDTGIWAGILAVLRSMLTAIQGLFGAIADLGRSIVNGIMNGLTGLFDDLFVPSDGFLESRYTTMENKWGSTSPAKYADAVSGFTVGSASGCGGLPLNVELGHGVRIDEHIGAACSGSMASAAGVVRAVLSAVIVVSGLVACVRAVGSGLGWNPGIGRGEV